MRSVAWRGVPMLRIAAALSAIAVVGWSVYQYDLSQELDAKIEQAEQLHVTCVAERKRLGQSTLLCREWAFMQVAETGSAKTRKRLTELAAASAAQSARECRQQLEARTRQLLLLEAELRSGDGTPRYRGQAEGARLSELRSQVTAIGIDCNNVERDIEFHGGGKA